MILSRNIFNQTTLGQYDFGLQQIELNNTDNRKTVEDIERIIRTQDLSTLSATEFEIFKTYKHETTHLIDGTSTLWGMEYTSRMYNWFNTPSETYLKVLSLNDAEIQMHSKLLSPRSEPNRFLKLKYSLEHDKHCGVFVHMHYLNEYNVVLQSTPITMLSLLEGHAFSQEQLLACEFYERNDDIVSITLLENSVEREISNLSGSEYSCFLAFINQLFPDLKLSHKLLIMILISRFSLNAPTFFIASFPEYILSHIFPGAPQELVSALKMEMARGMHRSTFCFALLLCLAMHSETTKITNSTSLEQMEEVLLKIYQSENESIEDVKSSLHWHWKMQFEMLVKLLSEKNANLASKLSEQLISKNWYFDELNALKLPDFFLSSDDKVEPLNRLEYDMEVHVEEMLEKVVNLETALKDIGVARQHLYPHIYHDWLTRIKSGETGSVYYPEASNGL